MTIVISGASGFLGTALQRAWTAAGHTVRGTGAHRLEDRVPAGLFAGADVVVHAAHAFGLDARDRNVDGTRALFASAHAAGVGQQIFISSYSAHAGAASVYGATKFALEQFFLEQGALVVRPGLVAGGGGMFARLARPLLRWHIAPLIHPDVRDVVIVSVDDFVRAVVELVCRRATGPFNLADPAPVSAREFARAVWRGAGERGAVVPIPRGLAVGALTIFRAHGALDRVRGRLSPPDPPHRSDLPSIVPDYMRAVDAVARAAAAVQEQRR